MGASSSSLSELGHNDYLKRLSGTEPVNPMDPFWNQLLSFSFLIPVSSADARLLEESTSLIARNFAINNCHTGNLQALVHNFMIRATELKASAQCEDNIFIWQTYNSLFIIRCLCKYFVEHLSEELLIQQFDCRPPNADGTPADDTDDEIGAHIEKFITALVELLVDVPVLNFTYALHLESLNMLLVLLSIQMFQPQPATQFKLYNYLMHGKCAIHAPLLVKVLLWNYINQEKCPAELFKNNEEAGLLSSVTNAVACSAVLKADESLNFDEQILEAAKSIAEATAALLKSASAAQRELVAQGKVSSTFHRHAVDEDGQWSQGLISAARMVAAATHSLCEAANAMVQGHASEEKLIASAKEVAGSTAQLLMACKVKADPGSVAMQRLQAAGNAVKRASEALVRAAQQERELTEEEESLSTSVWWAASRRKLWRRKKSCERRESCRMLDESWRKSGKKNTRIVPRRITILHLPSEFRSFHVISWTLNLHCYIDTPQKSHQN
ncbi:dymeclin-like [Littorina saxatilis]|uniref:dymeclin-like n=1 Tax=Littorina saxatilis TaxID=31220 RepID=UPI0038B5A88C